MKTSRNHNIRKLAVLFAGALGLLAAGCSKNPLADVPGGGSEGTGRTITATFDLTRDFEVAVDVKAGVEDAINDVFVFQMAPDGSRMLQKVLYISPLTVVDGDYRAKFEMQEAPCKLIFIANTNRPNGSYLDLPLSATEADIVLATPTRTDGNLTIEGLPMSGTWFGTPAVAVPTKVPMTRSLSKVTLNLGANLPSGDIFEVISAQVCQVPGIYYRYMGEGPQDGPYPDLSDAGVVYFPANVITDLKFVGGGGVFAYKSDIYVLFT